MKDLRGLSFGGCEKEEDTAYSDNMLTLAVEKRKNVGLPAGKAGASAAALRRAGSIPAVVYGAHHEATPISIQAIAFEKILHEAGEATIVSLSGLGEPLPTLIHEITYDPITDRPQHVDFYAVTKGEKVQVAIPITFIGESPAVEAGANLVKVLHEIEVEADPMNLPHDFEVDLSVLAAIDDQIRVKNLKLPVGVALITEPEEVIALVQEIVVEKEEEVAPADIASIEVEKKGKPESDEGAEAPEAEKE